MTEAKPPRAPGWTQPVEASTRTILAGLAPALVLAAVALWSTCRVVGAGAGVPGDGAWARAAALVRKVHQPGELIVFAPGWVDPVGRLHLGELIPLEMAGRLDAEPYGVVWELGIRGARAPETRGLRPIWQQDVDGVTVRRFERAPRVVETDLVARARDGRMQVSGAPARSPAVVLAEVGFAPRRCVQVVPAPGQSVTLTFPEVALGSELVGAVGLADVFTRRDVRYPATLTVAIGGEEVARVQVGVDDGWRRFRAPTAPGPATITVTASAPDPRARDRLVCVAIEARR